MDHAALRDRSPSELSPYEVVLRSFGYKERIDAEEHAFVRACLEEALAILSELRTFEDWSAV